MTDLNYPANINLSVNTNMSARSEIKKILERDIQENGRQPYHPKVLIKGGKPTAKALAYNKRLIKEGLTYKYLDPDVIVKRNLQSDGTIRVSTRKIKYDKRKKGKVPTKAFQNINKIGSVEVEGNLQNKTKVSYFNQLRKEINQLKGLPDGAKKTFVVDLKKISFDQLKILLRKFASDRRKTGKKFLVARPVGTPNYVMLSDTNLNTLESFMDLQGHKGIERTGSDNQFILNLDKNPMLEIDFEQKKVVGKRDGEFFPYYLKIPLDLDRYDIYTKPNKAKDEVMKYDENCLLIALQYGGMADSKLNQMKIFCKNGAFPTSHLNKICDLLDFRIELSVVRSDDTTNKKRVITYGKSGDLYKLGLYAGHYFINEQTKYTSYAVKNYHEIKGVKNWGSIYKKRDNQYRRDPSRKLMSYELVKLLVENKDKYLDEIPITDYLGSQYYSQLIESEDLSYDYKSCLDVNKPTKVDKTQYDIIYFDFETDTSGVKHEPYLMCARLQRFGFNEHKDYSCVGQDCGKDFIQWIKNNYSWFNPIEDDGKVADVNLIAHNIRYDYTFIYEYLYKLDPLFKGNSLMTGTARVYVGDKRYVELHFLDSCNLISTRLSNFGKMFNLPQGKEIMPYDLYDATHIDEHFVEQSECEKYVKSSDIDQYRENMKKWDCITEEDGLVYYDIIEYSRRYCEIDIEVLAKGFTQFRTWIKETTELDAINYCSIASLANDYMIKQGCFNGCLKIAGVPQHFIQKFVVGGRCMTKDNLKWRIDNDLVADYDCTSLYPSAMFRMEGYLKGKPKVIKNKRFDWLLNNSDGFFVKVECINNPTINRSFPLLSHIDPISGVRNFTNETKGKVFYLDKVSYEEAVKHQGLQFKIICGYYYNEGRNSKVNEVIRHCFNARIKAKKEGNPIQAIYKLLMNSAYGKTMLRPIDSETKIIDDVNFDNYIDKNYNYIKSYTDCGNIKVVKTIKVIDQHFNNVYAGVEVLSMSKRIMNEVMCLAEDNNINIYYQDTDSAHLLLKDVKPLEDLYRAKYDRELNGKDMGQFHIDFDLKGATKDIYATKSIFLGKKAYLDILEGKDNEGNVVKGSHVRMKGVNGEGIDHYGELYNCSTEDIYEHLYEHNTLPEDRSFSLLAGGKCCKFKYNPDMSVRSLSEFDRKVNFNYAKGILVS